MNPGYIYALDFGNGTKVGRTNNFKSRVRSYKKPWCLPILDYQIYVCDRPEIAEYKILAVYKKFISNIGSDEFIVGIDYKKIKQTCLRIVNEVNQ